MKNKIISMLVFLLVIAGIFIATQEDTNSQPQQTELSETEHLRDQLLAFSENEEEYEPEVYYKVVDNVEDAEMLFLNLAAGLKIEKQYIGTNVIWTATSSTQDTLRMTIHLQPTIEKCLGVIDVKVKEEPGIRQINLYEAGTCYDTVNYQRGVLNDVEY